MIAVLPLLLGRSVEPHLADFLADLCSVRSRDGVVVGPSPTGSRQPCQAKVPPCKIWVWFR